MGALAVGETALAKRKLIASVPPSRHILDSEDCSSESASSSSSTVPSDSGSSDSGASGDGSLIEGGTGTSLGAFDFCSALGVCLGVLESSPTTFFHSLFDIWSTRALVFLP